MSLAGWRSLRRCRLPRTAFLSAISWNSSRRAMRARADTSRLTDPECTPVLRTGRTMRVGGVTPHRLDVPVGCASQKLALNALQCVARWQPATHETADYVKRHGERTAGRCTPRKFRDIRASHTFTQRLGTCLDLVSAWRVTTRGAQYVTHRLHARKLFGCGARNVPGCNSSRSKLE